MLSPRYRDAGAEVIDVLCRFCKCVERASVDEAYLDLTEEVNERIESSVSHPSELVSVEHLPNTHVVGFDPKDSPDQCKATNAYC